MIGKVLGWIVDAALILMNIIWAVRYADEGNTAKTVLFCTYQPPLHSSITWVAKAVYAVSILQSPASFIRRKKSVSASKKYHQKVKLPCVLWVKQKGNLENFILRLIRL